MFSLSAETSKNFNQSQEKLMTTKELAEQLKTSPKVILENARKCLPNKVIENGKFTFWNEAEVTVLIDYSKNNSHRNDTTFTNLVKVTETELTPALKIKKAFDLMREGYEEELERLRLLNEQKENQLQEKKPKVESYNNFLARDKFCNFRDAANYLGTTQTELMSFLKSKYIYKNSVGEYRAYSDYSEYFTLRPFEKRYDKVGQQLMLNIKGLEYFKKYFSKEVANA